MGNRRGERSERRSVDELHDLVTRFTRVSTWWILAVVVAVLLSALDVTRATGGDWTVKFQVGSATVALVALLWLPALVRVIALTGGGIKTPAGEASAGGLIELLRPLAPDTKRTALSSVIAAVEAVADEVPGERGVALSARRDLERELSRVDGGPGAVRRLAELARSYERMRQQEPPGPNRTFRMSALAAEARAAVQGASISADYLRERFSTGREGDRLVALAGCQVAPDPSTLDLVIDVIADSRSAFEQFHALSAADELVGMLTHADKRRLEEAIVTARDRPLPGKDLDGSRRRLAESVLQRV